MPWISFRRRFVRRQAGHPAAPLIQRGLDVFVARAFFRDEGAVWPRVLQHDLGELGLPFEAERELGDRSRITHRSDSCVSTTFLHAHWPHTSVEVARAAGRSLPRTGRDVRWARRMWRTLRRTRTDRVQVAHALAREFVSHAATLSISSSRRHFQ